MEKTIKLVMNTDKSITINLEGKEQHIIKVENRQITADKIYAIFNFSPENTYKIEKQNDSNIDVKVLDFFYDLINDIAQKVNNIKRKEDVTIQEQ